MSKELISHHTFLLPFKWSKKGAKGIITTEDFVRAVGQYASSGNWSTEEFTLGHVVDYNEFHYFYDYVREALYDYSGAEGEDSRKGFIKHLQYENARGGKYTIKAPKPYSIWTQEEKDAKKKAQAEGSDFNAPTKTYVLEIDSILLHLYYTGVGVLSFHLNNRIGPEAGEYDQSTPDDILYINQYGRRIFAPFYNIDPDKTGYQEVFEEDDFTGPKGRPHGKELAYEISVSIPGHAEVYTEKWEGKPAPERHKDGSFTFPLAGFIKPFLGLLYEEHKIQSVLDDRMFTLCWYGNNDLVAELKPGRVVRQRPLQRGHRSASRKAKEADVDQARNELDWWYKFVFVDAGMVTVQHPTMRRKLLKDAMYLRWSGYGTYYGVTDYSMVLLTSNLKTLRKPDINAHFMVTHLQTIYFRLAELVLVQRACVQRFSDEVTHVSRLDVATLSKTPTEAELAEFDQNVRVLSQDANILYKHYIRFVNRVYFREVTAQVQGIELYEKLQRQARLPQLVDGLSEEIHELHNYVRQETDRQLVAADKQRSIQQKAQAKLVLAAEEKRRQEQEQQAKAQLVAEEKRRLEQEQQAKDQLAVEKERETAEKQRAETLSLLGALFIAPSLLVAVYDLGFIGDCFKTTIPYSFAITVTLAIISAGIFFAAFRSKKTWAKIAAGIIYLGFLLFPLYHCSDYFLKIDKEKSGPVKQERTQPKVIAPPIIGSLDSATESSTTLNQEPVKE